MGMEPPKKVSGGLGKHLLGALVDDLIDQSEVPGRFGSEKIVTLKRVFDLLQRLARVLHIDFVEPFLQVQNLQRMQHDVGGLALESTGRLVNHDAGIGESEALMLGSRGE